MSITMCLVASCNSKNKLGLNENASVNTLGDLPENPLLLNAITVFMHPRDSTITVLYGNDSAYNYAKVNSNGNYPESAVLYRVNWQMHADEQWFGANVPERIKTIDRLEFLGNNKTEYSCFDSKGQRSIELDNVEEKIYSIRSMKITVGP